MDSKRVKFIEYIEQSSKVAVIGHTNPDGDAIGSAIAISTIIDKNFNKQVKAFTPNRTPDYLTSIKGFEYVNDFLANPKEAVAYIRSCDLIICVDLYDYTSRTNEIGIHIEKNTTAKKVVFDHHVFSDLGLYDLTFVDSNSSSACNFILENIRALDLESAITKDVAEALYTGMMTDTGNFSFSNLNSQLYNNIAFLVDKGVVTSEVNNRIFNVKREASIRLNSYALHSKMVVDYKKKASVITLTRDELNQFGYQSGDTEGLVNIPLSIKGIQNSALFMEQEGMIKISLRSQGDDGCDTNKFAREFFNGGGHINASGGKSKNKTLEQCVAIFFENVDKY